MILKNIFGVHGRSSNTAVRCELGIFPLGIKSYGLMYGYYTHLNMLNSNDEQVGGPHFILKAAYEVDKLLTIKENSLANSVVQISKKLKLEDFYKSKINFELSNIRKDSSGKLLFYSKIVKSFEQQEYLNFNIPKELRNKLTKLRISAHSLAIETGRYSKPKTPSYEKFGKFCKEQVENESHFLLQCPQYMHITETKAWYICNEKNEDSPIFKKKLLNPTSFREIEIFCLYNIKEGFEERDHPTVH